MKKILKELESIENEHGFLTPQLVVQKASAEDSSMHNYFTWNDTEAGSKYRLWQARQLIKDVRVTIEGKKVNMFHHIKVSIDGQDKEAYLNVEKILNDENLREQVLLSAIKEIQYWQKKYNDIKELRGVINEPVLERLETEVNNA